LDFLKAMLDLLLAIIEAIIVQILTQLIMQLVRFLTQCPDIKCDIRPNDAAADDFGSLDLDDFFPDPPLPQSAINNLPEVIPPPPVLQNCTKIWGSIDIGNLDEIQSKLFSEISQNLSSGEMLNVLDRYASSASVNVIKEIIETDGQFESIRPYFNTYAKIEALVQCI
ncbi:MAG TPA: hypothetical protein DCM40_08375, partial [Maribacter sp.]|nr:hypothetical protein [Maribacter sp.]